jgi:hypothetical protein
MSLLYITTERENTPLWTDLLCLIKLCAMPEIMCMMERMSANFSKDDEAISNEPLTCFNKNKDAK